jgi:amino acid permease
MVFTMYVIIGWEFIEFILIQYGVLNFPMLDPAIMKVDDMNMQAFIPRALIMGAFFVIMTIVLTFMKQLAALRFLLIPTLMIYVYIIFITVFQTWDNIDYYKAKGTYEMTLWVRPVTMNWFSGIGTIIECFYAQPAFMYVRKEMFSPSERRMRKVLKSAIITTG